MTRSPDGRRYSVAAVIPTHNRARVLERALDSVLHQSRKPDEVIVVDSGSTDNTSELVGRYGAEVVYVKKGNAGVSAGRNEGVRRSGSDFVAFLDSDDFWYRDHLSHVCCAIERTGGSAGLYFSDLDLEASRGGGTAWKRSGLSVAGLDAFTADPAWAFLDVQPMSIQASVVRRDAYLAVGGCSEELMVREDTHLFFKLALSTAMCAVAGSAGTLTGGDDGSLSVAFGPRHVTYWESTVILYRDILRRYGSVLTREQQRTLSRELAKGHWELARGFDGRKPSRMVQHVVQVGRHYPTLIPRRAVSRMRARFAL
jgi:glycosyltransferase involved in cell wall biosynthesis